MGRKEKKRDETSSPKAAARRPRPHGQKRYICCVLKSREPMSNIVIGSESKACSLRGAAAGLSGHPAPGRASGPRLAEERRRCYTGRCPAAAPPPSQGPEGSSAPGRAPGPLGAMIARAGRHHFAARRRRPAPLPPGPPHHGSAEAQVTQDAQRVQVSPPKRGRFLRAAYIGRRALPPYWPASAGMSRPPS